MALSKRRLASRLIVAAVLSLEATGLADDAGNQQASFTLLSYNVRGLPKGFSFPGARFPSIGHLAGQFDIVLTQELFAGEPKLAGAMRQKQAIAGNGLRGDAGRIVLKAVLLPFTFFIPEFWPPYGSGLYTFVNPALLPSGDFAAPRGVERVAYTDCYGTLSSGMDCLSRKGFLRVRIQPAPGLEVDVYNTHLDAGNDPGSRNARQAQLRQLGCTIEAWGTGRPVIVAGDLNLGYARPGDREIITEFRERLALRDSGAGPENPWWRERDYILYRDGDSARLFVEQFGEAPDTVRDGYALSDHPAIFARFRVEADPLFGWQRPLELTERYVCDDEPGGPSQ